MVFNMWYPNPTLLARFSQSLYKLLYSVTQ